MKTLVWSSMTAARSRTRRSPRHRRVEARRSPSAGRRLGRRGGRRGRGKIAGVGKVHVADGAHLEHQLAEDVAPVAAALMAGHDAFLAPATTTGKNIAPRVAALLDVMQISDILSVEGEDTFTRPIYAGNAIATVKSKDAKKVITVRGTRSRRPRATAARARRAVDAGSAIGQVELRLAELSKASGPS
jgi:electron transfer flavoprotein alpha subunit